MRALVARKGEWNARDDIGIVDGPCRPPRGQQCEREEPTSIHARTDRGAAMPCARHYQSSRTARTAPMLVALCALARAVSVASASSATASSASDVHGT